MHLLVLHGPEDQTRVASLFESCSEAGIELDLEFHQLASSTVVEDQVNRGLSQAKVVVVALSPRVLESDGFDTSATFALYRIKSYGQALVMVALDEGLDLPPLIAPFVDVVPDPFSDYVRRFLEAFHKQGKIWPEDDIQDEARKVFERDLKQLQDSFKAEPLNWSSRLGLARRYAELAAYHRDDDEFPEGREALSKGIQLLETDVQAPTWILCELARLYQELYNLEVKAEDEAGSRAAILKSKALIEPLVDGSDLSDEWQHFYTEVLADLGDDYKVMGEMANALKVWQWQVDRLRPLIEKHPDRLRWQIDLTESCDSMAWIYGNQNDHGKALPLRNEVQETWKRLIGLRPELLEWKREWAESLGYLGQQYYDLDQIEEAESLLLEERTCLVALLEADPGNEKIRMALAKAYDYLGDVYNDKDDDEQMRSCYLEALQIFEGLAAGEDEPEYYSRELTVCYIRVGDVHLDYEEYHQAEIYYMKAKVIRQKLVELGPVRIEWQTDLASVLEKIGDLWFEQERYEAALAAYSESATLYEAMVAKYPEMLDFQSFLADRYRMRALACHYLERPDDARIGFHKALDCLEALAQHASYKEESSRDIMRVCVDLVDCELDGTGSYRSRALAIAEQFKRLGVFKDKDATYLESITGEESNEAED
jgi:tetratricopeptide (TPR) repeat protein